METLYSCLTYLALNTCGFHINHPLNTNIINNDKSSLSFQEIHLISKPKALKGTKEKCHFAYRLPLNHQKQNVASAVSFSPFNLFADVI